MPADPFAEGHWHEIRKAEEEARKKEIETLTRRATQKGNDLSKPKPVQKPYVPSSPFGNKHG